MPKNLNASCLVEVSNSILKGETEFLTIPVWVPETMRSMNNYVVLKDGSIEKESSLDVERRISEFRNDAVLSGYVFPWGHISESLISHDPNCEDDEPGVIFSFFLNDLTRKFPFPYEISQLFMSMYEVHYLHHPDFIFDDGIGIWDIFEIHAGGEKNIMKLRRWLVKTFLPKIFPALYAAAELQFISSRYVGRDGEVWQPLKG